MTHRSQPSDPSSELALNRWLYGTPKQMPWTPLTAGHFNRKKDYASKKTQLSTVLEEASQRETSSPRQFPFLCVFQFAGCDQKFENPRDWKDHVVSRHLGRTFWECTITDCAHAKCLINSTTSPPQSDRPEDWATEVVQGTYSGRVFENEHDFRTHLIEDHLSDAPKDADKHVEWLLCLQDSSMRTFSGLPQKLGCPMPKCKSMHFSGPKAWDLRLNHAAEHFRADPQCPGVFGGDKDRELVQWASSGKVAIVQKEGLVIARAPLVEDCAKSTADSGYGSMHSTAPSHMAQDTGIPPVRPKLPKIIVGSPDLVSLLTSKPTFLPKIPLTSLRSNLGSWDEGDLIQHDSSALDDQDSSVQNSIPDDPFSASDTCQGKSSAMSSFNTTVVDFEEEADETTPAAQENEAVMGWFHGWLREWLAPLTRPQGNECGPVQTTSTQPTSQDQTSGSGSNTGTQTQRRARQRHGEHKRKRIGEEEGDGNGESPKTQCSNGPSSLQRFACPFYKRNPRKYGQPKWKSCAHPGYKDVRRVKEHMYRRHLLPRYQCPRCYSDLETWAALQAHSQQEIACALRTGVIQDGITQDQEKCLRDKKRTAKQNSEVGKWKDAYAITFPHDDGDTPSPYLYDTDQGNSKNELNLCQDYGRFLFRELPPLVARHLATRGLPILDSIQTEIVQLVRQVVPQLHNSFLEEIGHSTSEQLNNGSANDGISVMETSAAGSGSEGPATRFPVGSTAEESITIFPTESGLRELATGLSADEASGNPATMFPPTAQEWEDIYAQLSLDPSFILGPVEAM